MTWPTEAERKARLCKRAGCDCSPEVAMTDPTPEEMLSKMSDMERAEFRRFYSVDDAQGFAESLTLQKIRAAIEAENEACAMKAGACAVAFGSLAEGASEPEFSNLLGCERGAQYVAAAIRARGTEE